MHVYKNKGDPRECSSHRSLLISSHVGKTLHRALRQHHYQLYASYQQGQQVGGRQKMPVGGALHMSRAYLRLHRAAKRPSAMIFLDLTEAFYRVIRPLAVGGCLSDQCIEHMIARLGLQPSDLEELYAHLSRPSALELAGAPAHVQNLLKAIHHDTWFVVDDQEDVVRTELGSRPGDGFADVIFGFLWGKLLRQLEKELVALNILDHFPQEHGLLWHDGNSDSPGQHAGPPQAFLGPTWMDDLCVCLSAEDNAALTQRIGVAAGMLIDLCRSHCMEPNLRKGTTEIMPSFCGSGSRAHRRRFFSQSTGATFPVMCETGLHQLTVVSRYTHLGGVIHHRDVTKSEIARRLSIAHGAITQHKKLLYKNPHLTWWKRIELFQTLVLSKLAYGLESWTFSCHRSRRQFHAGVMRLYRRLFDGAHDAHRSDEEVLQATGLPQPAELLRRARLRYLGTLYQAGSSICWGLINQDSSWLALLRTDLEWLWAQLENSTSLGHPGDRFAAWEEVILHYPGYWKKLINRGVRHASQQRKKEHIVANFHRRIFLYLENVGAVDPALLRQAPSEAMGHFGCMQCKQKFLSRAGEGVHLFKRHGICAAARSLFDGTSCPCCLRNYHSHSRVLAHLRHAHACRRTLVARGTRCTPAAGQGSKTDDQLLAANDGALPFLLAQGPHQPTGALHDFLDFDLETYEACYEAILNSDTVATAKEAICEVVTLRPISWTRCRRTLEQLCGDLTEEHLGDVAIPLNDLKQLLQEIAEPCAWTFLTDDKEQPTGKLGDHVQFWEARAQHLVEEGLPLLGNMGPHRPVGRHRILLHAFSGRRRRGDVEWYLNILAAKHAGCTVHVASLDIIIDPIYGDVGREGTRSTWLHAITQGWVIAFLGGPPCNTWSRARHVQVKGGPRVVRHVDEPWGLPSLRLREMEQIIMGNLLLGFALECMTLLAIYAGMGVLEHPKDPEIDYMVSIWRLPIVQLILLLPNTRMITMAQGLLGAPSPKPTSLLVVGLSGLEDDLRGHRLTPDLPQGQSVGRGADGGFLTAPLKEYPPAMCRALAQAFFRGMGEPCDEAPTTAPTEFLQLVRRMQDSEFGLFIGHDG